MTWDGTERRNVNQEDHDLLLKISSDTDHLVKSFDNHIVEDKETFKTIESKVNRHDKVLWVGMGIVITLQVILKILK